MLHVNFNAYSSYVTDSLYQWDINQKLNITGLNLTTAPEVHFANANMERAIVRESVLNKGTITVDIPNSLLQAPLPITAYIGIYEGETFKIIESVKIPVIPKQKPTDYVFIDDGGDIYSYNEILNKMISFENTYGGIDFDALKDCGQLVEDVRDLETRVTPINLGGTGATDADKARENLGIFLENLGNANVEVGSYDGTHTAGQNNPTKLTLSAQPKALIIQPTGDSGTGYLFNVWLYGVPTVLTHIDGNSRYSVNITWNGNEVSWYGSSQPYQLNNGGVTYRYIAIY